ncbi:MAG: hypothetical protein Faunusvirus61_2 [Faunusvirus sp.]|jgi:DNA-directed RNA polymerase subunit H (RpoH/RPB5)|uniref:RNA polymerase subunit H/Rpb5 C-terminal domain-containing protein n=1 Tax=Faunusvirus sp. TaxID=2487766 RepID=A0A3G4ZY36_9VIRU|nr:MAG: hypothetical protein Faunusvirus61_2 [Faunusvirus sp.]
MSNKLVNLEITEEKKNKTILKNVILMLINRNVLANKNSDHYMDAIMKTNPSFQGNDLEFDIKSDVIDKLYKIKYIYVTLSTIRKTPYEEMMMSSKHANKIIILPGPKVVAKIIKQFKEYSNTELFYDHNLMINLIDHHIVPKHTVLNDAERAEVLEAYKITKKMMPKIFTKDPVAKYYNLKRDDIVKIERPSPTSGISVTYKTVVARDE